MKEYFKKLFSENSQIKKTIGVILVFIGFIALITPFTPGSWLIFVGLELLGLSSLFGDKMANCAKFEQQIVNFLSHRPKFYALVVGVGIVLFWRGVWHSVDNLHRYFNSYQGYLSTDSFASPWWDGPLSLVIGIIVLYFSGAFISSFIGNELILSGLRGEKKLTEKTEGEVENEVRAISDIKDELGKITQTLEQLEKKVLEHHRNNS